MFRIDIERYFYVIKKTSSFEIETFVELIDASALINQRYSYSNKGSNQGVFGVKHPPPFQTLIVKLPPRNSEVKSNLIDFFFALHLYFGEQKMSFMGKYANQV